MKRTISILLVIIIGLSVLGCQKTNDNIAYGKEIFDKSLPEYKHDIAMSKFPLTLDAFPDVVFTMDEKSTLYANDEVLSYSCFSLYISDITKDGYPELCIVNAFGSGVCYISISIIDYKKNTQIFSLDGGMLHDYYLFLRDGALCVKETKWMEDNTVRTGVLSYDNSEVVVIWDEQ